MHKDLIIGITASAALHAAFIFGIPEPPPPKKVSAEIPVVEFVMPPLPDEPPEELEQRPDEEPIEVTFVPPSIVDIPQIDLSAEFTMPPAPPPPPDVPVSKGVTVPPSIPPNFGRNLGTIFNLEDLDQIPQARIQNPPNYPYEMRRAGINGEVEVHFICDAQGNVRDPYVIRSSQREFEQAALDAVKKWTFKPGRRAGRTVNVRMSVPVVFTITSD